MKYGYNRWLSDWINVWKKIREAYSVSETYTNILQ